MLRPSNLFFLLLDNNHVTGARTRCLSNSRRRTSIPERRWRWRRSSVSSITAPAACGCTATSTIPEPGPTGEDFAEARRAGVWLAKAGFGAIASARDYVALVRLTREAGLITTLHTGGASITGSFPVTGTDLLAIDPHVSFHINGGPVAIEDRWFDRAAAETGITMQVCTARNLRTTLLCAAAARRHGAADRFLIATNTPTGSGVIPLGMIYTMVNIAALADVDPT